MAVKQNFVKLRFVVFEILMKMCFDFSISNAPSLVAKPKCCFFCSCNHHYFRLFYVPAKSDAVVLQHPVYCYRSPWLDELSLDKADLTPYFSKVGLWVRIWKLLSFLLWGKTPANNCHSIRDYNL